MLSGWQQTNLKMQKKSNIYHWNWDWTFGELSKWIFCFELNALPSHRNPPLPNCHDLTWLDFNAIQMQMCNFATKYLFLWNLNLKKNFYYLIMIWFFRMVYNILFRCWNVLPETHFTKEPTRQILGKQFLHHYSYPWTISRHTKDSLFNCILHKKN